MHLSRAEFVLAYGQASALSAELRSSFLHAPDRGIADDLARFVCFDGPCPSWDGPERVFLDRIAALRCLGPDGGHEDMAAWRPHHEIGYAFDFLGERAEPEDWSILQGLNLLMQDRIKPRKRAAVVGTMRDDGIFALEWIAYYQALGFDRIVIYTNDNSDTSELLLRQLAAHNVITLVESVTSGKVRPEVKAFEHAVHLLPQLRDCEWALFVDSDEFLSLPPRYEHSVGKMLDAFEAAFPRQPPSSIVYEWRWFNSNFVYARGDGMLIERFQHATPHWLTKCMVRLRDLVSMRLQHIPELKSGCTVVNSAFMPFDCALAWEQRVAEYAGGAINHYWPKSFEEFSLKKARGETLDLEDDEYRRDFALFFSWNGPDTPESYHPLAPTVREKTASALASLRRLAGIAEREAEIELSFTRKVGRGERAESLRAAYRQLLPT